MNVILGAYVAMEIVRYREPYKRLCGIPVLW
jgi:hypothetical protein